MRVRLKALAAAGLFVGVCGAAAWLIRSDPAAGSALSRGALGWLAARRYAEARGVATRFLDRAESTLAADEVLVVVFPWQRAFLEGEARQTEEHLQRGGTVVVAYSGGLEDAGEERYLKALGLKRKAALGRLSLHPLRWQEQVTAEWSLRGAPSVPGALRARVRAMMRVPDVPSSAQTLFMNEAGLPLVAVLRLRRGRVVLLPAELLANARLGRQGHADTLEWLIGLTARRWAFDEYHHGLVAASGGSRDGGPHAVDLWVAHLALAYVLALMALIRRFGPAWIDPPVSSGSARAFFLALGTRHAQLGHHGEARQRLWARARDLDPNLELSEAGLDVAGDAAASFLRFARRVARAQQRRT